MNLKFVRRVGERERAIRPFVIVKNKLTSVLMSLSCYWQWISSSHCQSSLRIHSSIASWIHNYFDNVMTKFMINNRTDAWKTDVNLLNLRLNLRENYSGKNRRRRCPSNSLLGNVTYSYDVRPTRRGEFRYANLDSRLSLLCLVGSAPASPFLSLIGQNILDVKSQTSNSRVLRFDLFSYQVWLLEVNINPALHTNCQVLMDLLPGVVDETLSK